MKFKLFSKSKRCPRLPELHLRPDTPDAERQEFDRLRREFDRLADLMDEIDDELNTLEKQSMKKSVDTDDVYLRLKEVQVHDLQVRDKLRVLTPRISELAQKYHA